MKKIQTKFALLILPLLLLAVHLTPAQNRPMSVPMTRPADSLMRFVVYGDTRTNYDVHKEIVDKVVTYKPSFILQTGDLVENSSIDTLWKKFDEITLPMRAQIAYYPARGNHDNKGGDGYEQRVTQPFLPGGNKLYYAFERTQIRFIALDTEQELTPDSDQYKWLVKEINDAKAKHKFVVPYFHKAIFSIGFHGSDKNLRQILHPLFLANGIKLVFQGHDHLYYRSQRDGITYITTGGGGAPLNKLPLKHEDEAIAGDKFESVNHFCVCDVYKDKIVITALRKSLDVLDQISVPLPKS